MEQWGEEEQVETTLHKKKKKNSMEDLVGNEENEYPVPDHTKQ
jgi:hypothetical protein